MRKRWGYYIIIATVICAILLAWASFITLFCTQSRRISNDYNESMHRIQTSNYAEVLRESRLLMRNWTSFTNESAIDTASLKDSRPCVYGNSNQLKDYPAIQQLEPHYLLLHRSDLQIVCGKRSRIGLYAYAPHSGAEIGSEKLIDGLWIYDDRPYIIEQQRREGNGE